MRKHALSNNRDQMNPNGKPGILMREPDRLLERRSGNHQAGTCKHAVFVSANDCFVHFIRDTEVIRVDDQAKLC